MTVHLFSLQQSLTHAGIEGWLLYDYKGHNTFGLSLIGMKDPSMLTRRFFYWVPKSGNPLKICHVVDAPYVEHLPGKAILYSSWNELQGAVKSIFHNGWIIMMEFWPTADLPSQAILDATTKEWLNGEGLHITSSWPIIGESVAQLTPKQKKSHLQACTILNDAFSNTWQWLKEKLLANQEVTEVTLQAFMIAQIQENGGYFDHLPIVACGPHSASPHHIPKNTPIKSDSLVLIDAWCTTALNKAPYADFTQVAFAGKSAPQAMHKIYDIVKSAQRSALTYIQTCLDYHCAVIGCEVDNVCRTVIAAHGLERYFGHRTGHNIAFDLHGPGANLDMFETIDTRPLISQGCYSIEPGIYIPDTWGIRLECNILLDSSVSMIISGEAQENLRELLH